MAEKGLRSIVIIENSTKARGHVVLLLVIIAIIISSSVLAMSSSVLFMQIILASVTVALIARRPYKTAKLYTIIFAVSMCFVFCTFLANQWAYGNPYFIGGSDDLRFEEKGALIASTHMYNPKKLLGNVLDSWDDASFFSVYIAALMNFGDAFSGFSTFMPRIANVYFLIWIAMIFEEFLVSFTDFADEEIRIVVAIFTLTPNIQYINSHVFRDTLNLLQVFLIAYSIHRIRVHRSYLSRMLMLGILPILLYTAFYTRKMSLAFAGGLVVLSLVNRAKAGRSVVAILLLVFLVSSMSVLDEFRAVKSVLTTFRQYVETYSAYWQEGGLSAYIFAQPLLPFGILLRFCYALIRPFPDFTNLFRNPNHVALDLIRFLINCGVVCQISLVPFILKRTLKFDWLSQSFFLCCLGAIATTFTFRHVVFYYPFMVAVGVDGYMSSVKNGRKLVLLLWMLVVSVLGLIYLCLRNLAS